MTKAAIASPAGVDIFSIDPVAASEKGADIELVHPASQRGLGTFFNIIGNESDELRSFAKRKVSEQTRENFRKNKGRKPDPEQIARETVDRIFDRKSSVELAMVATKGWWRYANPEADKDEDKGRVDTITFNGEEVAFSPENLRRVLDARPWIAVQIDAGVQELDNFFPA